MGCFQLNNCVDSWSEIPGLMVKKEDFLELQTHNKRKKNTKFFFGLKETSYCLFGQGRRLVGIFGFYMFVLPPNSEK